MSNVILPSRAIPSLVLGVSPGSRSRSHGCGISFFRRQSRRSLRENARKVTFSNYRNLCMAKAEWMKLEHENGRVCSRTLSCISQREITVYYIYFKLTEPNLIIVTACVDDILVFVLI